jgi:hypothetical protein
MKSPPPLSVSPDDMAAGAFRFRIIDRPPPAAAKWHRVDDWAQEATANLGDVEEYVSGMNPRVSGWRGSWILDIDDNEEAFDKGVPLEQTIDVIPRGPGRKRGGYRRVSIRLFTWVIDTTHGDAYDPQWITTGWGMTAKAATHAHYRYLESYADAVARGIESRRLLATALEIVFWTASKTADYT